MALHGTVQVNGSVVGTWEAVRGGQLAPGWHEYAVLVNVHGNGVRGTVEHRYADGPAVLAAKALTLHSRPGQGGLRVSGTGACKASVGCGLPPRHQGGCVPADRIAATLERS